MSIDRLDARERQHAHHAGHTGQGAPVVKFEVRVAVVSVWRDDEVGYSAKDAHSDGHDPQRPGPPGELGQERREDGADEPAIRATLRGGPHKDERCVCAVS